MSLPRMAPDAQALAGVLAARGELARETVDRMYALMCESFEDLTREVFEADLAEKDHVILLRDGAGEVQGFSTILRYETRLGDEEVSVVFSGDTIVSRPFWGSSALVHAWLGSVLGMRRPGRRMFWFLLCSGWRTYRFLPVFWREFWPRHDQETPSELRAAMEALASTRYGARYGGGVVRSVGTPLREGIAPVTPERLKNPHVAFFVSANPFHLRGDELVCLTELDEANLSRAGHRALRALR